jgi:hypothetical protein
MQSTSTTNYRTRIATLAGDFLKKASTAITGGDFGTAQVLCESAGDLLAATRTKTVASTRRGRPRKPVTESEAGKEAQAGNGAGEKAKPNLPAILAASGPMTREQVLKATGWAPQAANLQLARLIRGTKKRGPEIYEVDGLYRAISAPAPDVAERATA